MPKSGPNKEGALAASIKKALQETYPGCLVERTGPAVYGGAGRPDIIACINGWYVGMEIKLPAQRKRVTEKQKLWLERIKNAGGRSGVITSVEEAIAFCDGLQQRSSLF